MIHNMWQGKNKLFYILIPFSWCYAVVIYIRKKLYQIGWLDSWKAPVPIIMVGNLTAGGNGKTPLVIWLVKQLTARGLKVGVVSRGYKGKSKVYPLLVDDNSHPQVVGDEPILIYQATHVPVAVAPSRVAACQCLLKQFQLDILITDDGLQHYALQRDYEIVVVDYLRQFGNQQLLPAGPLREALSRLNEVDLIIQNGGGEAQDYVMQLQAEYMINLKTKAMVPVNQVTACYAMAGIGFPSRFFHTLKQYNITILKQHAFADHHHYTENEIKMVFPKSDYPLIMTEKDAVKCYAFAHENWWYVPVEASFNSTQAESLLNHLLSKLSHFKSFKEALCR